MADFAKVNEVYAKHLGGSRPARSTVAVAALAARRARGDRVRGEGGLSGAMTAATRDDVVRLTQFARCAGCAAKMGPGDLSAALAPLERRTDPRILVGRETFDDAGVFQLSPDLALVQTLDFFAPIVDDPYDFGRVAAANALSDVFAMGGEPITAMNIVGFPVGQLPLTVLTDMLRGGQDTVHEAGAHVVGGHTITDEELKYGLSVTGTVHPVRMLTNAAAKPGDALVLTKAIGTGILATAAKRGVLGAAGERRARAVDDHAERRGEPRRRRDSACAARPTSRASACSAMPRTSRARATSRCSIEIVEAFRSCPEPARRSPPARSPAAPRGTTRTWNRSSTGDVPRRTSAPSSWIRRRRAGCWSPFRRPARRVSRSRRRGGGTSAKCGSVLILVNGSVFKTDAT